MERRCSSKRPCIVPRLCAAAARGPEGYPACRQVLSAAHGRNRDPSAGSVRRAEQIDGSARHRCERRSHRRATEVLDGVRVSRVPTLLTARLHSALPGNGRAKSGAPKPIWCISICPIPWPCWPIWRAAIAGRLVVTYHSDTVRQKVLGPLFEPLLHQRCAAARAIIATSPNYLPHLPRAGALSRPLPRDPLRHRIEQFEQCRSRPRWRSSARELRRPADPQRRAPGLLQRI